MRLKKPVTSPEARLVACATRFRAALEQVRDNWDRLVEDRCEQLCEDKNDLFDPFFHMKMVFGIFKYFPCSCCHHATALLLRYLHDQGFDHGKSITGNLNGSDSRHTWICVQNKIVDITADQFKELIPIPAPIIVTTDFHLYEAYPKHSINYTPGWLKWDKEYREYAEQFYQVVVALIPDDPAYL
jgi:hypothetical protein